MVANENAVDLYLLHAPGRADLGMETRDDQARENEFLSLLNSSTEVDWMRKFLLLQLPEQQAGRAAPLAEALSALSSNHDLAASRLHLILVCTEWVTQIADAIKRALDVVPDPYGRPFHQVAIVRSKHLEEEDIARHTADVLRAQVEPSTRRAVVTWGSGSTQATLGALDAVIQAGLQWSLVWTNPWRAARLAVYSPTDELPVDPLVPLLRRWRYHDLLWDLTQRGEIDVAEEQRRILELEAEQWGRAYVEPTAARLRAVMAAALMRGDGSSGFAVRAYIVQRYQELRAREAQDIDLLEWARRQVGERATLGPLLGAIDRERRDRRVARLRNSPSGHWLISGAADKLNKMGAASSHELVPPAPPMLAALREHLDDCHELAGPSSVTPDQLARAGLSPLNLVPGRRAWYVAILPPENRKGRHIIEQIAEAAVDPARRAALDAPVRRYLGVSGTDEMPIGLLVLGTESATAEAAHALAEKWRRRLPAAAVTIEDQEESYGGVPVGGLTVETATGRLRDHLDDDAGAVVLVPTGPKEHVLPLLAAAQRVTAERGIPLYLRQLVDRNKEVLAAGIHRFPLRFGADLAMLGAALHAIDCGELDTSARLLDGVGVARDLGERVLALSYALRCDMTQLQAWPDEVRRGRSGEDLAARLIAERTEVWATRPGLVSDVATQMRAVVGACATTDTSTKDTPYKGRARQAMRELFEVRNRLPITHGRAGNTLEALVRTHSGGRFGTPAQLLAGMVDRARVTFGAPADGRPSLAQLLGAVRAEVSALYGSAAATTTRPTRVR